MSETTIRLHSFLTMDAKAREAELNRMARSGWELVRVYWDLFARFRRTERTDLRYFVDWRDPKEYGTEAYRQLCADAGWEPVRELTYETVYASRSGARPVPIQTDPELEYQRFRKKVLRRMLLACVPALFLLLLVLLVVLLRPENLRGLLLDFAAESNLLALLLVTAPVTLPALLVYAADGALHLRAWRRAGEDGEPLAAPGHGFVRLGSALHVLVRLIRLMLIPALLADMLLNHLFTTFNLVVFAAGFLITLGSRSDEPKIRKQVPGCLVLILLLFLLHFSCGPLREVWPGRLSAAPALEGFEVWSDQRSDTFLGSQAEWHEVSTEEEENMENLLASLRVSARVWALPILAELDRAPISEGYRPVEGLEGVWQLTEQPDPGVWHRYVLLRRDAIEVELRYYGDEHDFDLIGLALDWAEPERLT